MRVASASDLGLAVRQERRRRRMSQTELCRVAEVSRRWLTDLEGGKATAEIGLVFRIVHALGMVIEVSPWNSDLDLDDLLNAYGHG